MSEAPLGRKLLGSLDPFAHRLYAKDDGRSKKFHFPLTLLFILLWLAYAIYSLVAFAKRPEVETFSLRPVSTSQDISITITCTGSCGSVNISSSCVNEPQSSSSPQPVIVTPTTFGVTNTIKICYTPITSDSRGTRIDFPSLACNTDLGSVLIERKNQGNPMQYRIDMECWQRKTVVIGQSVREKKEDASLFLGSSSTSVESRSLTMSNLQYDGRNPTNAARLYVQLAQFENVFERSRPGSVLDAFAAIGGQSAMIVSGLGIILHLLRYCFPPDKDERGGGGDRRGDGNAMKMDNI